MALPLTAIIILTIKEAVRKKTFLILAIFAAALISSSAFFPVLDRVSQLKLVEQWTVRAIVLFATLIAIFTTGASLPSDIEEKRIQTLISKPIGKMTIILGKFCGFAAVTAVAILLMGIIGYCYIRVVHTVGRDDLPPLAAFPTVTTNDVAVENGIREPDPDGVRLTSPDEARGRFTWTFRNLDRDRFDDDIPCRFLISISIDMVMTGNVRAAARNPETGREIVRTILIKSNVPAELLIPRDLIDDRGKLVVTVDKAEPDCHLQTRPENLLLYERDAGFEGTYVCGLLTIFAQTLIVTTATLMASAFLSTPVSVFFGLFVFFCGGVYGSTVESLKTSERMVLRMEEKAAKGERVHVSPNEINPTVIKISNTIAGAVLAVLPDFRRFDYGPTLLNNLDFPRGTVPGAIVYSFQYVAVFILLGTLVIRSKDLG